MKPIHLRLSDMAYGGAAVGRHEGKAVFVPGGIPGEEVRVEIVQDRPRYARARLLKVLAPSPERVAPPCPQFGRCGGCQWQHVEYGAQLRYKQRIVESHLQRIGRIPSPPLRPPIGMAHPWRYRNNMQFVVDREGHLCLMAAGSHRPVPVGDCHLLCPELGQVLAELELDLPDLAGVTLRAGRRTGERMLVLATRGADVPELEVDRPLSCVLLRPDGSIAPLIGSPYLHEELAGRRLRVSAGSFFQVNTEQAEALLEVVREYARIEPGETVLDAYGGVGTIGLALAGRAGRVLIAEASPSAAADARKNASSVPNATVIEGAVEAVLPALEGAIDVAVLDPPRAGVAARALAALAARRPRRIVYVSCDPSTLARDLGRLLEQGYALQEVQPVDMFPQTYHVECVALLAAR